MVVRGTKSLKRMSRFLHYFVPLGLYVLEQSHFDKMRIEGGAKRGFWSANAYDNPPSLALSICFLALIRLRI